jgi:hypothetical protein
MRATVLVLVAACGGGHLSARHTSNSRCVPIRVVDEAGAPQVGWTVHSEATAWVGPGGAFYVEGGSPQTVLGSAAVTGTDGVACIDDASAALDAARDDFEYADQHGSSLANVYVGGFGPTRMGHTQDVTVIAERPGFPSVHANALLGFPASLRVGPARTGHVHVTSLCAVDSISAYAAGPQAILGVRDAVTADGVDVRFPNMGPGTFDVHVTSCDDPVDVALDTVDNEYPRTQVATAVPPVPAPSGTFMHLAMADYQEVGCVSTSTHALGCFDKVYARPDGSYVPHWLAVTPLSVSKLVASGAAMCALTMDGDVYCWGAGAHSLVGWHVFPDPPMKAPLPGPALDIAIEHHQACATLRSGEVSCWGERDTAAPRKTVPPRCRITDDGAIACHVK